MYPLTITCARDEKELHLLTRFLLKQPQFYPKHDNWIHKKCIPGIRTSSYNAIVAMSSDHEVIGNIIYKVVGPKKVELKNLRIDPLYRNRDLGHFLLSQLQHEVEGAEIFTDVSVVNFPAVEFLIRNKFYIVGKESLYLPNQDEYLMVKSVR